jgi:hypothetical protein
MKGVEQLCASLIYGAGLRLLEAMQLRIKDVDLLRQQLIVRDGKGRKDRATLSSTSATSMPSTCAQVPATFSDRTPCASSTRPPRASGLGSGSSQRPATTPTPRRASAAATTFTRASSSAPSARPPVPPAFQDP